MRSASKAILLGVLVGSAWSLPASAVVGTPAALASSDRRLIPVEYYCSPGFEPGRGGTCVAVPSRAEVELFVDQPIAGPFYRHRRHHYHRRALRERY